jgi:hypothetical protein
MTKRVSALAAGAMALGVTIGAAFGTGTAGAATDRPTPPHAVRTLVIVDPASGRTLWSGPASAAPAKIVVLDPSTGRVLETLTPPRSR